MVKLNQAAAAIDRFIKSLDGTVAASPIQYWIIIQIINKTANITSKRIILQLVHEYVVPPHWRARSRQMIEGKKTKRKPD